MAVSRIERYCLLYGYVGTAFHGSQHNGAQDEARCPTAEGALLGAVEAMVRGQGAELASAEVHSRTSRTDRGVHALANAVYLRLSTTFKHGSLASPVLEEAEWLQAVRRELPPTVVVLRRFSLSSSDVDAQNAAFDCRRACKKREYFYFVPYRALLPVAELAAADAEEAEERHLGRRYALLAAAGQRLPTAPQLAGPAPEPASAMAAIKDGCGGRSKAAEDELHRTVWVCDLPNGCPASTLHAFINARLAAAGRADAVALVEDVRCAHSIGR